MTSAYIIKELRGARALRLFCGRSSFPPGFSIKYNNDWGKPCENCDDSGPQIGRPFKG
ncbi:hypothetical cytosolic protein [Syntrophus aciditrophicus SB]|uniref:Hypothetical cytosolic protein n=1 Tax=Syntrophus aciditrophicus (strain SB) TaxID=56780 RepID=Q2LTV8_SYNAS|nr:hypothetical cytosolic protein [Syntrophus aciditrophicus SB]